MRLWNADLEHVHVVRLDGAKGRQQRDVIYHEDGWRPDDVHAKQEMLVLGADQCALGAASLTSVESAVGLLDSCLDLELSDEASLWAEHARTDVLAPPREAPDLAAADASGRSVAR